MPDVDESDLARDVLIAAPYDGEITSTVKVESLPVWFDLGWQKVADEDYGIYNDLEPAPASSSPSADLAKNPASKTVSPQPPGGPGAPQGPVNDKP